MANELDTSNTQREDAVKIRTMSHLDLQVPLGAVLLLLPPHTLERVVPLRVARLGQRLEFGILLRTRIGRLVLAARCLAQAGEVSRRNDHAVCHVRA